MKNMNFDDITTALEALGKTMDFGVYPISPVSLSNSSFVSHIPSLTSGLYLSPSVYSGNITYDQDIFSELPIRVFDEAHNIQMAKFMKIFRTVFYKKILDEPREILPKLYYHYDDSELNENIRLASEWDEGNAMLYLSFEKLPEESSFGLIWNDSKRKNYQTRSGNLYLNENEDIVHEAIDFVFRVY